MSICADDNTNIANVVDYAHDLKIDNAVTLHRARATLHDAMGAVLESIRCSADCAWMIRPSFPGEATVPGGYRLPETLYQLDVLEPVFPGLIGIIHQATMYHLWAL